MAQQILKQDFQGEREAGHITQTGFLGFRDTVVVIFLSINIERTANIQAVVTSCCQRFAP